MDTPKNRPERKFLHMVNCVNWAHRSVCKREGGQNGAIVVSPTLDEIWSYGYNGPAKGLPHDRCRNEPGNCGCLHAEDNAISRANRSLRDGVMFATSSPCEMCAQRIIQAGISELYYLFPYRNRVGLDLLETNPLRVIAIRMPFDPFWHDLRDLFTTTTVYLSYRVDSLPST